MHMSHNLMSVKTIRTGGWQTTCWKLAVSCLAALSLPSTLQAQVQQPEDDLVYRLDAYGNAQAVDLQWRPVGSFQNRVQREALQGYQTSTRRLGQRSGLEPFALPNDVWSVSRLAATGTSEAPAVRPSLSAARKRAFQRYGGFTPRNDRTGGEPRSDLFTRKHGLFAATALNAPVYRAMTRDDTLVDLRSAVVRTPFLVSDLQEPPGGDAPTLDQHLDYSAGLEHQRVRGEAWTLFREGQYRQAIRAFESAVTLQPADFESRIGEIFAYLSVGARRTAIALFGELIRRDDDAVLHDLNLAQRFGNLADAQALQIQARLAVEEAEQRPDVRALYVLVLWYLGQHDDAIRAAAPLAQQAPTKPYAAWDEMMKSVRRAAPPASKP